MSINDKTTAINLALKLESKRRELIKARDFEALKSLISPEIIYVHSTGGVDTFETYFQKLIDQTLVYLDVDYVDVDGTLFGETLIITGKMNAQLILGTEEKSVHSIYMTTWIKQKDSHWVMCAHQGAPRLNV